MSCFRLVIFPSAIRKQQRLDKFIFLRFYPFERDKKFDADLVVSAQNSPSYPGYRPTHPFPFPNHVFHAEPGLRLRLMTKRC